MIISIISWIVFGFLVGLLARFLMPGRQPMGIAATTILGVIGSFVGGAVGNMLAGYDALRLNPTGFIGSLLGAILVLALVGFARRHTA